MRAILLTLALSATPLMAAFPQPVLTENLAYGQKEASLTFQADCAIRKAKPLCKCTSLSIQGTTLKAKVDVSDFANPIVEKELEATTADGATTRLTMRFIVPQAVQLSARSLIWKQGSPARPKEVHLRIPHGSPVHAMAEAAISGDAFDYAPRIVKRGAEYAVSVTPRSTEHTALNRLIIKTDSADPRYAQYIIYLSIQSN